MARSGSMAKSKKTFRPALTGFRQVISGSCARHRACAGGQAFGGQRFAFCELAAAPARRPSALLPQRPQHGRLPLTTAAAAAAIRLLTPAPDPAAPARDSDFKQNNAVNLRRGDPCDVMFSGWRYCLWPCSGQSRRAATTSRSPSRSCRSCRPRKQAGTLKGFSIDLQVDEGTVWLSGRVASEQQQAKALDLARRVRRRQAGGRRPDDQRPPPSRRRQCRQRPVDEPAPRPPCNRPAAAARAAPAAPPACDRGIGTTSAD